MNRRSELPRPTGTKFSGAVRCCLKRRVPRILPAALLCLAALGQANAGPKLSTAQAAALPRVLREARVGAATLDPAAGMMLLSSMAAAEARRYPANALRDHRSALALAQTLPQDDPALTVQIHHVEISAVRAVVAARGLDAGMEIERAISGDPAPVAAELLRDHPDARQVAELAARCNPPDTQPVSFHFACAARAISALPAGGPLRESLLRAALAAAWAETEPEKMYQVAGLLNHRFAGSGAWPELTDAVVNGVAETLLLRLRPMKPSKPERKDWVVPARWELFTVMGGQRPDLGPALRREFPEVVPAHHYPGDPSVKLAPRTPPSAAEMSALRAFRSLSMNQAHYADGDGKAPPNTLRRSFAILDGVRWQRAYPDIVGIAIGIEKRGTRAERGHLLGSATDFLLRAEADYSRSLLTASPAEQAEMVSELLNDINGEGQYAFEVNALDRVALLDFDGAARRLDAARSAARPVFLAALAFGLLMARYSD